MGDALGYDKRPVQVQVIDAIMANWRETPERRRANMKALLRQLHLVSGIEVTTAPVEYPAYMGAVLSLRLIAEPDIDYTWSLKSTLLGELSRDMGLDTITSDDDTGQPPAVIDVRPFDGRRVDLVTGEPV